VLDEVCEERDQLKARLLKPRIEQRMVEDYRRAGKRLMFLDYDGTLMPFAKDPREVRPTGRVLALLEALATDPNNEVVVISGRDRNTLEHWLGHLPVGLIAEHGVFVRFAGQEWASIQPLNNDWKPSIRPVLEMYADRLPGAFVEEKEYSLVWHYRGADPELGMMRAQELLDHLVNFTANIDVQVLQGNKVIEVKTGGINKGTTGMFWLDRAHPITDTQLPPESAIASSVGADFVLAIGDDWTDEYLFAALPESAYSIRVGLVYSRARFNLSDSSAVLDLLDHLVRAGNSDAPSRGDLAVSR
jgi:trehalose 6-phosphate synthase/phosphatase